VHFFEGDKWITLQPKIDLILSKPEPLRSIADRDLAQRKYRKIVKLLLRKSIEFFQLTQKSTILLQLNLQALSNSEAVSDSRRSLSTNFIMYKALSLKKIIVIVIIILVIE
jgi:hypothetical protein